MTSCLHSTTTLRLDHGCWRGSRSPPGSPKAIFEVEPFGDAGLALATNPTDDARAHPLAPRHHDLRRDLRLHDARLPSGRRARARPHRGHHQHRSYRPARAVASRHRRVTPELDLAHVDQHLDDHARVEQSLWTHSLGHASENDGAAPETSWHGDVPGAIGRGAIDLCNPQR